MFNRLMNYSEIESKPNTVLTLDLIKRNLPRYKRHDDMVIIQESAWESFKRSLPLLVVKDKNTPFSVDEDELAFLVCQTIQKPHCRRLALDKGVKNDDYRTPSIEIILGDDGIICRRENHISLEFDITKCMYSFGNINEKMRMGRLDCSSEIVVDLFAGIGYFTLPLLIHASASHVYACEWNEEAVKALKKNLKLNKIAPERYTVIEGDNRLNRPTNVAQRVLLGILPSSFDWITTAYECMDKKTGALFHFHDLVECKPMTNLNVSFTNGKDNTSSSSSTSSNDESKRSNTTKENQQEQKQQQNEDINQNSDSPLVLLEYPTEEQQTNITFQNESSSTTSSNGGSVGAREDHSLNDSSISVNELEMETYKARAQKFVTCLQGEIDQDKGHLKVKVLDIHVIKSYAPYTNHLVFDIQAKPPRN